MRSAAYSRPTKQQIITALDRAGLKNLDKGKYLLTQCPFHEDSIPSAQVFLDEGFVHCHAGCERQHITRAFPELKGETTPSRSAPRTKIRNEAPSRADRSLYDRWLQLPLIPRDHRFKTIPLEVLDGLGWRWDQAQNSYLIPYWDRAKKTIPFAQWRHLSGDRRFTFLKGASPIAYGLWNLQPESTLFIVEGTSDGAALEYCAIPWIAMPSASSGAILERLCVYAADNHIQLIYAGDNDEAGERLKDHMICAFRQCRPRGKDWAEMLEATSQETVQDYCLSTIR